MKITKFNIASIHRLKFEFDTIDDAKAKGMVYGVEANYKFFCLTIYFRNFTILIEV